MHQRKNDNTSTSYVTRDTPSEQKKPSTDPESPRPPRNFIWGNHTEEDLKQIINAICEEIVFFKKNLFLLPAGKAGKEFISEMTKLVNYSINNSAAVSNISIKMMM